MARYGKIKSKLVLNLDGRPLCGAAAGEMELHMTFPTTMTRVKPSMELFELSVDGLTGGHTGVDALLERGNAIVLLTRCLIVLESKIDYQLLKIDGGNQRPSAFARNASCIVAIPSGSERLLAHTMSEMEQYFKVELENRDEAHIYIKRQEPVEQEYAFSEPSKKKLLDFLTIMPDGLYTRDHAHEGHLQCSSNTGVVKTKESSIYIATLIRSHLSSMKDFLYHKIATICKRMEISIEIEHDLPVFKYNINEHLHNLLETIYSDMSVDICDGCLECGLFSSNIEDVTVISLALPHYYPHSPSEHFFVDDAMLCYKRFLALLQALK